MEQHLCCTRKSEAFEQILLQYSPMIYKMIRQLHITHEQEEFFAEGRLALYEAFLNFDKEKGNFSAYAFSLIRGKMLKKLKQAHRAAQAGSLELCEEAGYCPTADWETGLWIQQVFQGLSETEKRLFILVFLQDQSVAAAIRSPELNLSYRQGKYMMQGIRRKFKREWEAHRKINP